jgi:hypothetical protein
MCLGRICFELANEDVCQHGQNENRMQVKKMGQLEQEIKTLSGQQTKHHVKIKVNF